MVIIQPSGGLCNRMRVINSSLELAKRKGTKLLVLWYCAEELNAPFEALFQPVDEFKVINFTSLKDLRKLWYQLTARTRINIPLHPDRKQSSSLTSKQQYQDS